MLKLTKLLSRIATSSLSKLKTMNLMGFDQVFILAHNLGITRSELKKYNFKYKQNMFQNNYKQYSQFLIPNFRPVNFFDGFKQNMLLLYNIPNEYQLQNIFLMTKASSLHVWKDCFQRPAVIRLTFQNVNKYQEALTKQFQYNKQKLIVKTRLQQDEEHPFNRTLVIPVQKTYSINQLLLHFSKYGHITGFMMGQSNIIRYSKQQLYNKLRQQNPQNNYQIIYVKKDRSTESQFWKNQPLKVSQQERGIMQWVVKSKQNQTFYNKYFQEKTKPTQIRYCYQDPKFESNQPQNKGYIVLTFSCIEQAQLCFFAQSLKQKKQILLFNGEEYYELDKQIINKKLIEINRVVKESNKSQSDKESIQKEILTNQLKKYRNEQSHQYQKQVLKQFIKKSNSRFPIHYSEQLDQKIKQNGIQREEQQDKIRKLDNFDKSETDFHLQQLKFQSSKLKRQRQIEQKQEKIKKEFLLYKSQLIDQQRKKKSTKQDNNNIQQDKDQQDLDIKDNQQDQNEEIQKIQQDDQQLNLFSQKPLQTSKKSKINKIKQIQQFNQIQLSPQYLQDQQQIQQAKQQQQQMTQQKQQDKLQQQNAQQQMNLQQVQEQQQQEQQKLQQQQENGQQGQEQQKQQGQEQLEEEGKQQIQQKQRNDYQQFVNLKMNLVEQNQGQLLNKIKQNFSTLMTKKYKTFIKMLIDIYFGILPQKRVKYSQKFPFNIPLKQNGDPFLEDNVIQKIVHILKNQFQKNELLDFWSQMKQMIYLYGRQHNPYSSANLREIIEFGVLQQTYKVHQQNKQKLVKNLNLYQQQFGVHYKVFKDGDEQKIAKLRKYDFKYSLKLLLMQQQLKQECIKQMRRSNIKQQDIKNYLKEIQNGQIPKELYNKMKNYQNLDQLVQITNISKQDIMKLMSWNNYAQFIKEVSIQKTIQQKLLETNELEKKDLVKDISDVKFIDKQEFFIKSTFNQL